MEASTTWLCPNDEFKREKTSSVAADEGCSKMALARDGISFPPFYCWTSLLSKLAVTSDNYTFTFLHVE